MQTYLCSRHKVEIYKRRKMLPPLATHEMTCHAQIVNSFLCEFKKILLAISLASHECAPSQEVALRCLLPKRKFKNNPSPLQTP